MASDTVGKISLILGLKEETICKNYYIFNVLCLIYICIAL